MESFSRLFADNTLIAKEITTQEDGGKLQDDLNIVEEWKKTWGMEFNVVKCHVLTEMNKRYILCN